MSLTQRLARFSAARPRRMLVAWGLVLLASIVAIGALLGSALTTDQSVTSNPESQRAADVLLQSFPHQQGADEFVVLHSGTLTADDAAFKGFVSEVRASLGGTGATQAVTDPYASDGGPPAISRDQHAVLVAVTMGPDPETNIIDVLDQVQAADKDPAFDAAITGEFTIDHDFNELASHDLEQGELQIGLPAALIVLLLVFGAVVAALLPMGIAIVSIIVTVALSALVGQAVTLSFFIVNMITAMGLALGIDYSLFVLSRYREERHEGLAKRDAIVASGGTASKAVLFSGSSFVVALCGLLLVPDTILRSLAFGAILVGIVTVVAALTLLPALLALLGDRVNALRLPFFGREQHGESRLWKRAVSVVVRRPIAALAVSVLFLLVLAAPVLDLRTGNAGVSSLPDSTFSKAGFVALERSFPSASADPAQVVIVGNVRSSAGTAALARLESALAADTGFGPPVREVAADGDVAVLGVPVRGDPNSDRARAAVERLRTDLVPASLTDTDLTGYVGGATAENIDYTDLINKWLPIVLVFVLGVSLILLTVLFRSVVLAGTAVVLNLLSVGAAYGLLVLVFQKGYGTELLGFQQVERVEAWVPVFLFSVLFALSMDYHVFLITRIRERYMQSGDTVDAVVHGIAATGRIITGAALIIVTVFAGFAAGDLVMFQQMGFGVGVALLLDATVIRMIVVPATMTLLQRWNWYLPSWLEWLPELHVEGDPELAHGVASTPTVITLPEQQDVDLGSPADEEATPRT